MSWLLNLNRYCAVGYIPSTSFVVLLGMFRRRCIHNNQVYYAFVCFSHIKYHAVIYLHVVQYAVLCHYQFLLDAYWTMLYTSTFLSFTKNIQTVRCILQRININDLPDTVTILIHILKASQGQAPRSFKCSNRAIIYSSINNISICGGLKHKLIITFVPRYCFVHAYVYRLLQPV